MAPMDIEFILRGTSPLLCHNPRMVDPEYEINVRIKELTKKRNKTAADLAEIRKLEWYGGNYEAEINGRWVVSQPTSKVRKSIQGAAKISKQGKSVERALVMTALNVPLIYEGCEAAKDFAAELDRLQSDKAFNSYLSVGVNGKRVMRIRPEFKQWALIVPALYIDDAGLNFAELANLFTLAGRAERIGDNRVNGYGAFVGTVREITPASRPVVPTLAGVDKFLASLEAKSA
jgi:hypothetical protein